MTLLAEKTITLLAEKTMQQLMLFSSLKHYNANKTPGRQETIYQLLSNCGGNTKKKKLNRNKSLQVASILLLLQPPFV